MPSMPVGTSLPRPDMLALLDRLRGIVGDAHLLCGADDRRYFSTDVFSRGVEPDAIVAPGDVAQLAAIAALCHAEGVAMIPRGAGLSYTGGYLADAAGLVIDLRRLDRIIEINPEDMYVRVQPGCRWAVLIETLAAQNLRTPYFGPASGHSSTVGGAVSQGSICYGSAEHGSSAESVLGLTVVLADGSIVTTGAGAGGGSPFLRNYGPDLTGMFLNDCGGLAMKVEIVLQLIPLPERTEFASFLFPDASRLLTAMSQISRQGLASETLAMDPNLLGKRLKQESIGSDLGRLWSVAKAGRGWFGGMRDAARIVLAGRRSLDRGAHTLHLTLDGTRATVAENIDRCRALALAAGGAEIEPSIPRVIRADPFAARFGNGTLSADGARFLPIHAIIPHSQAIALVAEIEALLSAEAAAMAGVGVRSSYLLMTIGRSAVLFEVLLHWPDAPNHFHERVAEPAYLKGLPKNSDNPRAVAMVSALRGRILAICDKRPAAHFQIGRTYHYIETRSAEFRALLARVKRAVDPKGLMNPGVLGLVSGIDRA